MPGSRPKPTSEDGPFFREAYGHADAIDRAAAPGERRKAWAGFIPRALAALAEGFLRESLIIGAVLFSVIVGVIGATSENPIRTVTGIASGIVGTMLVLLAVARHWAFGRQWAVILGVILFQCVFLVLFWTGQ